MTTRPKHAADGAETGRRRWSGWSCRCTVAGGRLIARQVTSGDPGLVALGEAVGAHLVAAGLDLRDLVDFREAAHAGTPAGRDVVLDDFEYRLSLTPIGSGECVLGCADAPPSGRSNADDALRWLRAAFRGSEQLVWGGLVIDGRIIPAFMSDGFRSILPPETGLGDAPRAWINAIHTEDRGAVQQRLDRLGKHPATDVLEYRIVRPSGDVTWFRSTLASGRTQDGAPQVWGIIVDITAERMAHDAASRLLSVVRDAVVEFGWDAEGEWCVPYVSPYAALTLTGDPELGSFTPDQFRDRLDPDDHLTLSTALKRLRAGLRSQHVSLRITGTDGARRQLEGTLVSGRDEDGGHRALGVLSDVTGRRAIERRLGRIAEVISDVVFEAEIVDETQWRLPYISPSAANLLGEPIPSDPSASGSAFMAAVHVDDQSSLLIAGRQALEASEPVQLHVRMIGLDGDVRRIRVTLIRYETGEGGHHLAGTLSDVTDQWRLEQRAGRISEAVGAILVDGVVMSDGRWRLRNAPSRLERLMGQPLPMDPAARGDAWFRALHPDDRGRSADAVRRALRDGESSRMILRVVRDGEVRVVRQLTAPAAQPHSGNEFAIVIIDVTDIRSPGDRLERVLDVLSEIVVEAEPDDQGEWRIVYASAAADRLLGRSMADDGRGRGQALEASIAAADAPALQETLRRLGDTGGSQAVTFQVERVPGDIRWVRATLARRDDPPARPAVAGIVTDVTELIETGRALRQAGKRLTAQMATHGSIKYQVRRRDDGGWDTVKLAGNLEPVLGADIPASPDARTDLWVSRMLPEEIRAQRKIMDEVLASGRSQLALFRMRTDGGSRWMQSSVTRLDERTVVGTVVDVDDAIAADAAIRNAQRGLAEIIEGLGEAVYELRISTDGTSKMTFATPRLWGLVDTRVERREDPVHAIRERVHPADRVRFDRAINDALDGVPLAIEYRVVHADAEVRWLRMSGQPRAVDDSTMVLAGTVCDITEVRADAASPEGEPERPRDEAEGTPLTTRQHDVLRLLAQGAATDEIAEEFGISRTTVANHVAAILRRLGARSRLEAVHIARRTGVIPPGL
ncbi:MAG: PAS domain-containing protein [Actinobacteria bacterium]|nr:PAS domain-containing protein [Actinomycetota bacterium]